MVKTEKKSVFLIKNVSGNNQSIIKLTLTSHHMHIKLIQPFYFCLMELKCFYINFLLNFFFIHNVPASRSCSKYLLLFLLSFNMHSKRLFSGKKNWINTKHAIQANMTQTFSPKMVNILSDIQEMHMLSHHHVSYNVIWRNDVMSCYSVIWNMV